MSQSAPKRIGLIVPSTNTTIERPVFSGLINTLFGVEVVITRLKVTTIAGSSASDRQFHPRRILAATKLLADAHPDSISWTGTSGLWLGMDYETDLLESMSNVAGVPATSATVALFAALSEYEPAAVSLLTPYETPVHQAVLATYHDAGFTIAADHHFGITDNASFATIPGDVLREAVKSLSHTGIVSVVCTNILACVNGMDVVDSTLAMFWHAIALAGSASDLTYRSFYRAVSERIGLPRETDRKTSPSE